MDIQTFEDLLENNQKYEEMMALRAICEYKKDKAAGKLKKLKSLGMIVFIRPLRPINFVGNLHLIGHFLFTILVEFCFNFLKVMKLFLSILVRMTFIKVES